MEALGHVEIHIQDYANPGKLKTDTFDIAELRETLTCVEEMLFPDKKQERPMITLQILNGSVIERFTTSLTAVARFSGILALVINLQELHGLDKKTAESFMKLQAYSVKNNRSIALSTSENQSKLKITPESKYDHYDDGAWTETEFFFYGEIVDAGGKSNPNIHLDVPEKGVLTISTKKEILSDQKENLLYKTVGVHAKGKKNIISGDIDVGSLSLIKFIDYVPAWDENYINGLIEKGSKVWSGIDVDTWLDEIRGRE
ncbi:MAG: hypothetical protein GX927_14745 [Lentisphaerae bacterium]|jgi:hypothetical protein|nr:hypothetical protein [Lentisphaerota bacterium]